MIPNEMDTPNKFEVDCWIIRTIKATAESMAPIKLMVLLASIFLAFLKLT